METPEETTTPPVRARSFTVPNVKLAVLVRYGTVTGLLFAGFGLMAGGCLAWLVGESLLFFGCFFAGAIFVGTGALGLLKCLNPQ